MNNAPRQTLRRILAKYGNDLCADARRCEALLKDLCGEYRREINVLTNAIEERIPLDLLAAGSSMPRELLLNRLAKRLEDNLGLTTEAAHWAVDSWALALGSMTEPEVEAKEKKRNNQTPIAPPKPIETLPRDSRIQAPKIQPPIQSRQPQPAPRPPQTPPKTQSPQIYPPTARPPVGFPMPAPQQRSGSNVNVPQNPPQPSDPTLNPAPKKRFGKFFGCLFVFFMLIATGIVLLFGVPYAIEVMRETQQSDPPRFPPQ